MRECCDTFKGIGACTKIGPFLVDIQLGSGHVGSCGRNHQSKALCVLFVQNFQAIPYDLLEWSGCKNVRNFDKLGTHAVLLLSTDFGRVIVFRYETHDKHRQEDKDDGV
jgi:hypothetical protein